MLRQPPSSLAALAVLLAVATVSESSLPSLRPAAAQSPAPAQPASVPAGTKVRINGSTSMTAISESLKQKFESQFPGATVELQTRSVEDALNAVRQGQSDLAAIGRSLTPEEQAQGLVQVPITRRKIAVVVGDQNSFPGDLTGEQFAAIFRGEITNWSEVGGADRRIRVVDRTTSDTRPALQPYPVFQAGEFKTGETGAPINDDSVDAMIRELGDDGISYAIVDQVVNKPGVRIITLYGTPPTDPTYPFSQALTYVYQGPQANPAVAAFLGYAAAPDNQQTVATAGAPQESVGNIAAPVAPPAPVTDPNAAASPSPAADPNAAAPSPAPADPNAAASPADPNAAPDAVAQAPAAGAATDRTGVPWWLWLLSIPLLGALLFTLFRGLDRSEDAAGGAGGVVAGAAGAAGAAGTIPEDRLVLVPRSPQDAYAYWEISEATKQRARKEEGGQQLALRLYDVTGQDLELHPAHSIEQFDCEETDRDRHLPIPQSDRDYMAELGYVTYQGRWIRLAQSEPVHIPSDDSDLTFTATDFPAADFPASEPPAVSSSWDEVPPQSSTAGMTPPPFPTLPTMSGSFREGGMPLVDPATFPPVDAGAEPSIAEPSDTESSIAEPSTDSGMSGLGDALKATLAGGAIGAGAVGAGLGGQRPSRVRRSQIVMVPKDGQNAYIYWEVLDHHKEIAKQHGGEEFILRVCDVTGIDVEQQAPHRVQQFNCAETDSDRHVTVPSDGDYVAEIGYLANNGRWLRIARSAPVTVSSSQ